MVVSPPRKLTNTMSIEKLPNNCKVYNNNIPSYVLQYVKKSLATVTFERLHNDKSISIMTGKKRGNLMYSFTTDIKARCINKKACNIFHSEPSKLTSNTIFITLTTQYEPGNLKSTKEAWKKVDKRLPSFIKQLKLKYENVSYVWCKEAHEEGGCHVHMALIFGKQYYFTKAINEHNKEFFSNETLSNEIEKYWKIGKTFTEGVIHKNNVFEYISKELNKNSCCERALKRALKNESLKKNDKNKIWTSWAIESLHADGYKYIRTFGYSQKTLGYTKEEYEAEKLLRIKEIAQEKQEALINNRNNSEKIVTTLEKSPVVREAFLTKKKVCKSNFVMITGFVNDLEEYNFHLKNIKKYGVYTFANTAPEHTFQEKFDIYMELCKKLEKNKGTAKDILLREKFAKELLNDKEKLESLLLAS